ncbi:MAG: hypothetical protein GWM92_08795 [Gemmatimonadetes bacterium]|nr:hypothetical protein [Gemmatimonadota bacterium]NIR78734.1 hypothetical protein [Gemmatimonadota bacterium]NIT87373.1 hypothetical protein [Gemmatimonadota bacterium]NIU31217.1 hypothetical protein [Gemmatimonadota bacterium]NIU35938.1 hypothetical protein [Gemmatimonadota bacterium]
MCRFVAYAGPERSARALVFGGTHPLVEQSWAPRELLYGSVNADGYGVGWYDDGRPVRIARPEPVWYDPELERLLETVRGSLVVASLRNATPGIPLGPEAIAPLVREGHLFVFNGYIQEFGPRYLRRFLDTVPDDLFGTLRSVSDTETLFLMALAHVRRGADPGEALEAVVREVREAVGDELEAQLNLLLADERGVAVTRASSVEETNSLYLARDPSLARGGIVVASEALDEEPVWTPVEPQSLVMAHVDGTVRTKDL